MTRLKSFATPKNAPQLNVATRILPVQITSALPISMLLLLTFVNRTLVPQMNVATKTKDVTLINVQLVSMSWKMPWKYVLRRIVNRMSAVARTRLVNFMIVRLASIKHPLQCAVQQNAHLRNAVVKIPLVLIMNVPITTFQLPPTLVAVQHAQQRSVAKRRLQPPRQSLYTVILGSVLQASRRTCEEMHAMELHAVMPSAVTSR